MSGHEKFGYLAQLVSVVLIMKIILLDNFVVSFSQLAVGYLVGIRAG